MINIRNYGEMQVKTTMKYHFTLIRMATLKRQERTSVGEDVEKRELSCVLLMGMEIALATVENSRLP